MPLSPNPSVDLEVEQNRSPATDIEHRLPDVFCWTKMQAEAGQPLQHIITRKELERSLGSGVFFWGVGNSLGTRVERLLRRTASPKVAFSVMHSRPKTSDVNPGEVLLWTAFEMLGKTHALPSHVIVISRGGTVRNQKTRHYALVCRSEERLEIRRRGTINLGSFRNIGSATPNVGPSQVTTILERDCRESGGLAYGIDMIADLVSPTFVRLVAPRPLSEAERNELARISAAPPNERVWCQFVADLRSVRRHTVGGEPDLFSLVP